MSRIANHHPEILLARQSWNPETSAHDMMLLELDYASGQCFPDDLPDYDSDQYAEYAAREEAELLRLWRDGKIPF